MIVFKHLKLLLWRAWLQKRRSISSLVIEMLLPSLIFIILVLVRGQIAKSPKPAGTHAGLMASCCMP